MISNISIFGLGKLGASMVAGMASRGFNVIGVDVSKHAVDAVNGGRPLVQETGLGEMIAAEHWIKTLSESKVEQIELSGEGQSGVIRLEDLMRVHQQVRFQEHSIRALRCTIARTLLGGSFRDFAARLADSPLLQWFCQVAQLDRVKVPAKSTVQRYATWLPEEEMREVINGLLRKAGAAMVDGKQVLDLEEPLDLSTMFLDTTCVKANIHFPVDWVLLRDGVKSLMQSVELIRSHGLKSRMSEPQEFITKINRLSMEMTHTRRKKDSNKERKRVLREMKRVVTVVRAHAQRYHTLLDENWQATDWTRPQAEQVLKRLESILEALPLAVKQAHDASSESGKWPIMKSF